VTSSNFKNAEEREREGWGGGGGRGGGGVESASIKERDWARYSLRSDEKKGPPNERNLKNLGNRDTRAEVEESDWGEGDIHTHRRVLILGQ